jgi:kinesin family protein 20
LNFFEKHQTSYAARRGETRSKFSFSKAFDANATQAEVFDGVARPLVDAFLRDGRTSLLFAYGCTNAGKTHTITGPERDAGIVPRAFECIFKSIGAVSTYQDRCELGQEKRSFDDYYRLEHGMQKDCIKLDPAFKHCVWLSYLEIYNEQVFDLLQEPTTARDEKRDVLKVKEDKNRHVFVKGLKESLVRNVAAGMKLLQQGMKNRQVGATLLNHDSSRSHSVLQIKLVSIPRDVPRDELQANPDLIRYSKLSIVDLAGSERASRTQSQAKALREAANINLSLTTFHRCLEALRQQQVERELLAAQPRGRRGASTTKPNGAVVMPPFRESQLTRLFQDYFVGDGVASMIVNINPLASEFDETSQVLKVSALAQDVVIESRTDTGRAAAAAPAALQAAALQASAQLQQQQQQQQQAQLEQVRQAQAQIVRLQLQAAGGATYDPESQVVLDNDVFNSLVEELDDLKDELMEASHEAAAIEARVRIEASNELAERLARLDDAFRQRLHNEVEAVEEKYRSKLAIAQRFQEHKHVRENEKTSELHKAFEFVKGENEKLEASLAALRQRLVDSEALLAKTAEQTSMALNAVQAERARLENDARAAAERFENVIASRQMESENLRAQLADAKRAAAAVEAERDRLASQVKHLMEERDSLQSECNDWRKQMTSAASKSRAAPPPLVVAAEPKEAAPPAKRRLRSRNAIATSPKPADDKKAADDAVAEDAPYLLKDGAMLWKGAVGTSVSGQGVSVTFEEPVLAVKLDAANTADDDFEAVAVIADGGFDDDDAGTAAEDEEVPHNAEDDTTMLFSALASPVGKTPVSKARSFEKQSAQKAAPPSGRARAHTVQADASPVAVPVMAPPKSVKKVQASISQFAAKTAAPQQSAAVMEATDAAASEWSDVTLSDKSATSATTSTSGARRRFFPATYSKKASGPIAAPDAKALDAAFGFTSSKDRAAANKHAVVTHYGAKKAASPQQQVPAGPAPQRGKSGGVKALFNKFRKHDDDGDEVVVPLDGDDGDDDDAVVAPKKIQRKPTFGRKAGAAEIENRTVNPTRM